MSDKQHEYYRKHMDKVKEDPELLEAHKAKKKEINQTYYANAKAKKDDIVEVNRLMEQKMAELQKAFDEKV